VLLEILEFPEIPRRLYAGLWSKCSNRQVQLLISSCARHQILIARVTMAVESAIRHHPRPVFAYLSFPDLSSISMRHSQLNSVLAFFGSWFALLTIFQRSSRFSLNASPASWIMLEHLALEYMMCSSLTRYAFLGNDVSKTKRPVSLAAHSSANIESSL